MTNVFIRYKTEFLCNSFKPDKDLCGRNVVLLQSTVLHDMLDITTDICYTIAVPCYHGNMHLNNDSISQRNTSNTWHVISNAIDICGRQSAHADKFMFSDTVSVE